MAGLLDFLQSASNTVASNVSAPVDGINWLLRKAGLPVSDQPMGGTDWMEQRGLTKPVAQSTASLAGETVGLLSPMMAVAKAPQIARGLLQMGENAAIPQILNKQAGMIKTPFGKIPETSKEIDAMAEYFRTRGESLGHDVQSNASNVSGSRYVTFKRGESPDFQVRISNHGDNYPNQLAGTGERFSIDPDSGNTFEVAKQWLKDGGINLSHRVKAAKTVDEQAPTNYAQFATDFVNGQWIQRPVKYVPVNGKMTTVFLD